MEDTFTDTVHEVSVRQPSLPERIVLTGLSYTLVVVLLGTAGYLANRMRYAGDDAEMNAALASGGNYVTDYNGAHTDYYKIECTRPGYANAFLQAFDPNKSQNFLDRDTRYAWSDLPAVRCNNFGTPKGPKADPG